MKEFLLLLCCVATLGRAKGPRVKFESLIRIALANRFKAKVVDGREDLKKSRYLVLFNKFPPNKSQFFK